jgi:hypothetical protein
VTSVFVDAPAREAISHKGFGPLAQQVLNVKIKKGESRSDPPLSKDFQCCAEPTRSCFITLTSTRPPLVCFAMVPSALPAGELPRLIT